MRERMYRAFHLEGDVCAEQLEQTDVATSRLRALLPLSDDEMLAMDSYDESFLVRFTYNSAAIEGSTLSLVDTALVLEGEFMPSDPADKRLSDVFAARGVADGVAFMHRALVDGLPLSETLIKDIHERTALDCQPRTRGSYRSAAVWIRGSETTTAPVHEIRDYMADLLYQFEESSEHTIIKAAAFHAMFENIHPFADGNGRVGRIVMNFMLQQAGHPPIAIKAAGRADYLRAMEDWQVRDNPKPLISLIAGQVVEEAEARAAGIMQSR